MISCTLDFNWLSCECWLCVNNVWFFLSNWDILKKTSSCPFHGHDHWVLWSRIVTIQSRGKTFGPVSHLATNFMTWLHQPPIGHCMSHVLPSTKESCHTFKYHLWHKNFDYDDGGYFLVHDQWLFHTNHQHMHWQTEQSLHWKVLERHEKLLSVV